MISERVEPNEFNFWRNFVVDAAFAAAFAWFGATRHDGSPLQTGGLVLAGILSWPFFEYFTHRWLLHGPWRLVRKGHTEHHQHPKVTRVTGWYAHPLTGIGAGAILAAFSSPATGALLMSGIYVGYLWFRTVHRTVHYYEERLGGEESLGRRIFGTRLELHTEHHERPNGHYGVTTSICDRLFGTFKEL